VARDVDLLAQSLRGKGVRGYWVQKLELFRADGYPKNLIQIATVYTRLGNKDEAFRWLDTAFKDHVPYFGLEPAREPGPGWPSLGAALHGSAAPSRTRFG